MGLIQRYKLKKQQKKEREAKEKLDSLDYTITTATSMIEMTRERIKTLKSYGDEIPDRLKNLRNEIDLAFDSAKNLLDQGKSSDCINAVTLLTEKLHDVEGEQTTLDNDRNSYERAYELLVDDIDEMQTAWGKDLSSDLIEMRQEVFEVATAVLDEADKFEFSDALKLFNEEDLPGLVTSAKNEKAQFDRDKQEFEVEFPKAVGLYNSFWSHPECKRTPQVTEKRSQMVGDKVGAQLAAEKFEFADALTHVNEIKNNHPVALALADQWADYHTVADKYESSVKELEKLSVNTRDRNAQAARNCFEEAQTLATQNKFPEAKRRLVDILPVYNQVMKRETTDALKRRATDVIKQLEGHPQASVIANELKVMKQQEEDAVLNLNNNLHKAANEISWVINIAADVAKKIADASQAYEDLLKSVASDVQKLKDLKVSEVESRIKAFDEKLLAAADLASLKKRLYGDAKLLLGEIAAELPAVKKLAEQYAKVTSDNETVLKESPDKALGELRKVLSELEKRPEEVLTVIKDHLSTARGKLTDAEKQLGM